MNSLLKIKYLNPEAEILLLCARTKMDSERTIMLKTLAQKKINWDYLISIAQKNKLLPLLYWHLNSLCPDAVPEIFLNSIKRYFQNNSRSNLYLTKELCRVLNLFEEHGIPAIPYKGPVLAT